jgi:hypothetical protein
MRSHISVHRATAKNFSNSFVFKIKIEKEGLPSDSPAGLGAGGPEFKSRRPDQMYPAYFLQLIESTFHPKLRCGILAHRSSEFASPLILEISFRLNIQEYRPKERKFRNY